MARLGSDLGKDCTAGFSDTFLKPPPLYKIMVSAAHKDTRENWNSQGSKKKKAPGREGDVSNKMPCIISTFFSSETFNIKEISPERSFEMFNLQSKDKLRGCCIFSTGAIRN